MISCFHVDTEDNSTNVKMNRGKGKKSRDENLFCGPILPNVDPVPSHGRKTAKPLLKINVIDINNRGGTAFRPFEHNNFQFKRGNKRTMSAQKSPLIQRESLDLPDGSCFNRSMILRFSSKLSTKECLYIGSFLVEGSDLDSKTSFVREQLRKLKDCSARRRRVVIVVSETGIKVCRPKTKSVLMAHALRRISLSTCDPGQRHFSFLAREPKGHARLQYCHAFLTDTAQQAEELSRLLGDSFRMAFAQQLQQQHQQQPQQVHPAPPPTTSTPSSPLVATSAAFLDLLCEIQSNRLDNTFGVSNGNGLGSNCFSSHHGCPESPGPSGLHRPAVKKSAPSSPATSSPVRRDSKDCPLPSPRRMVNQQQASKVTQQREMNGNSEPVVIGAALAAQRLGQSSPFYGTPTERVWAKTVVGHTKHHDPLSDRGASAASGFSPGIRLSPLTPRSTAPPPSSFQPAFASTSSSSATAGSELWSPSSSSSCEDNTGHLGSPTEFNSCSQFREKPPLVKTLESSWTIAEMEESRSLEDTLTVTRERESSSSVEARSSHDAKCPQVPGEAVVVLPPAKQDSKSSFEQSQSDDGRSVSSGSSSCDLSNSGPNIKRASQSSNSENTLPGSEDSQSECSSLTGSNKRRGGRLVSTPPPIPERPNLARYDRHDSLSSQEEEEEKELRGAPWFQAGIPREIALEILAQEPVGSFMVRESTSKPGCYALSLRVPRDFQPTGIAHYLIMRTHKGFKIKGFMKEFCTLTALITHHSVMPELLPCPLSLSRYNPVFRKQDTSEDMVDIEDPDYNLLADFRKVMSDLKV